MAFDTVLSQKGIYHVHDGPTLAELNALDANPNNQTRRNCGAVWTGEKRCPKKGEWYLSGAVVEAYRALNNLTTEYHIAKLVAVEEKTVIVRA